MNPSPLFRKVTQIGLVVRNADETAKRCWEQFGLGPWTFYVFDPSKTRDMTIRGKRVDHAMRTAHATVGDIDWEIIQPLDDKSIYAEHLKTHGEGLHHILFAVDEYAEAKAQLEGGGHPELASGQWAGNPYAYFDTQKSLACIAELWSPPADSKDIPPPDGSHPEGASFVTNSNQSMTRLHNKIAIVTGGASGLGAAIARRFASEGAKVVLADVQADAGQRLADELRCDFVAQDVRDEKHWDAVIGQVVSRHGGLHILVNNAGIEGPFDIANPENTRLSDWQSIHRVNVEGVFLGCRAAIPALRQSGGGAIINLSSTAALGATPDFAAYGASKAAVSHLTQSVALHCARDGSNIRCNSVHPGLVLTPMLQRIFTDTAKRRGVSTEQVLNEYKSSVPQGEFLDPADIASAVTFLASDEAQRITGLAMVIDGGCTLK